ncbi:hypothetical protein [Parasulfitobacter algicola]|uniref:Predicted pPIWI-associating nuclease domain-containing protein n=1 Tax=Parasulfitobacter algicola TaxID=2614809 RepID=A0ABX2IUK3_9RHOB|nr:hypothetical protein [Sulfitobacter algicola]NSX55691.1 hypothetical protein [Sulfitobacter algicola]
MAKRISVSQFRSKISQAKSKIRQAQNKQKQAINKYNQAVRTHNSKVRAHNARVRANRERLRRELQKLARTSSKPQYVTLRTSVTTVQKSYNILEERAAADVYDERYDRFLDLSEREAANSVSVINALEGETPENESDQAVSSQIDHILEKISQDVQDRWHGALYSLDPKNPDAARHFCTSARELLTEILERFAVDEDVKNALSNCELTPQGKPTRRAKIKYFLHQQGVGDDAVTDFIEDDMKNVVQLFRVFNDGTHGSSGRFEHAQLLAIRSRVEGAVTFLWSVISGTAFATS